MDNTLARYIEILNPFLPETIVDHDSLECIKNISRQLPLISFGCFEFWFGDSQSRIDFDISINGILNEHRLTKSYFTKNNRKNVFEQQALNEDVVRFFELWCDRNFQLKYFIKQCWLAYDILDPKTGVINSWYYIMFTDLPVFRNVLLKSSIILRTLSVLNDPFSVEFKHKLKVFFDTISPSILISGIGIQTSRGIHSLRVYLVIQQYEEIILFLKKHCWPGNLDDLHEQISGFAGGCNLFGLCVDLGPELQPKIGIEFWFSAETAPEGIKNITNKLIGLGLCTSAKQKAFLDWGGDFILDNEPNVWSWPDWYQSSPTEIPTQVVIRRISRYIKIVFSPGEPMVAKGYLGFDRPVFNNRK